MCACKHVSRVSVLTLARVVSSSLRRTRPATSARRRCRAQCSWTHASSTPVRTACTSGLERATHHANDGREAGRRAFGRLVPTQLTVVEPQWLREVRSVCVCVFFNSVHSCSIVFTCVQRRTRGLERQALTKVISCVILLFPASVLAPAFTRARGADWKRQP